MGDEGLGKRRDRDAGEFDRATHRRVADRVERTLMRLVVLGLVGLVVVQMLAVSPSLRRKLNLLEGAEGYTLTENSSWWQMLTADAVATTAPARKYTVTVQLQTRRSAPKARLLVGGKAVADFANGQASVSVEPGDLVAVDGSAYAEPLTFRVVAWPGQASPPLGEEYITRGSQRSIGVVVRPKQ